MPDEIKIKSIAVIGAGTMGQGIAQACITSGFKVQLFDLNTKLVVKAMQSISGNLDVLVDKRKLGQAERETMKANLHPADRLSDINADLVIEAIIEKLEPKQRLMSDLENHQPSMTLATNTSTFPVQQVGALLKDPSRCIGLHFFNPAHLMKLVEVITTERNSQELIQEVMAFCRALKKEPVLAKDSPGFIVNRVARPYYVESLKVLEESGATFETIDKLMKASGFRMGPYELMDLIGIDVNLAVTTSLYEAMNVPRFKPSDLQQRKVRNGEFGRKTGKGFYEYQKD